MYNRPMEEIYRLVRVLRESRLSRNRNFDAHATQAARAARRIHRFLRGVERDLRRSQGVVSASRDDGGVRLEFAVPELRFRRTVEIDPSAHAVLLEDAETASLLARAVRLAR